MNIVRNILYTLTQSKREDNAPVVTRDRELRDNLSEKQIDKMSEDSFPASDPPSLY